MRNLICLMTLLINSSYASSDYLCTKNYSNYLYSAASFSSMKEKSLGKYTPLKIIDKNGDWYSVRGKDSHGYIHQKYVTDNFKCMTIIDPRNTTCPNKAISKVTPKLNESLKILKQEIGCNYVQNRYGSKSWVSSINIWPMDNAMILKF